jgi:hypothetical protein
MSKNKLYCIDCKKITKHSPKLSAILAGYMVCDKCSKMNGFCSLLKVGDELFQKHSRNIQWVEFDENGRGKESHDNPMVGCSLLMSPFNASFTWMTTVVTEIIEERENYVHFKTENSEYILHYNRKNVEESN